DSGTAQAEASRYSSSSPIRNCRTLQSKGCPPHLPRWIARASFGCFPTFERCCASRGSSHRHRFRPTGGLRDPPGRKESCSRTNRCSSKERIRGRPEKQKKL